MLTVLLRKLHNVLTFQSNEAEGPVHGEQGFNFLKGTNLLILKILFLFCISFTEI